VHEALDELRAKLNGDRIDFAELVILGARAKARRLPADAKSAREAAMSLAEMIRNGDGPMVDLAAAEEVKHLGLIANLTLTLDGELLKQARLRALERDTSVNALVGDYLKGLVDQAAARDAMRAFLELAEHSDSGSGPGGRTWTRDELYER
jgi:hypothetical protein